MKPVVITKKRSKLSNSTCSTNSQALESGYFINQVLSYVFGVDPNKYLCVFGEGNKYDGICYEIVVYAD